jgi:hypothetical protein
MVTPFFKSWKAKKVGKAPKVRSTPLGSVLPVVKNVPEAMWKIENALGPTGRISN